MEYISRTAEEILSELQSLSASPESKVTGTFSNDLLSANAIEFAKVELELSELYQAVFPQYSWDDYLTLQAEAFGVIRRAATKAVGTLQVTGNGSIPAGSIFSTEEGTRFISTEAAQIVETGEVKIEAAEVGAAGNVAADTITKIPLNIAGIYSVTNAEPTIDGYDEEDDETLRWCLLQKVRQPANSGNPAQYVQETMTISGVGAAICQRTPGGVPGTVKVIITDSNFEQANEELISRVKEHLNSWRPVGILNGEIFVVSAQPVTINVAADVTTADETQFRAGVEEYFSALIRKNFLEQGESQRISAAKIGALILSSGGDDYDYSSLRLNGEMADILLDLDEIPKLGEVHFY